MKNNIITTKKFEKQLKLMKKRGYNLKLLYNIIQKLAKKEKLPIKNKDHNLIGNYNGTRECHIASNWLLIYKYDKENNLILILLETGTHSDLFDK